jgi:hypothetical protein
MEYLTLAIKVAETLYALKQDLTPLFAQIRAARAKPGGPTEADMDALKAIEDAQSAELDAPFDPA